MTNRLENIKCPYCSNTSQFKIVALIAADALAAASVSNDGAEFHGDAQWSDNSPITCTQCDRQGTVGYFRTPRPLRAFNVRVKRTYLETYRVSAENEREAMRNWMEGDYHGQDEHAIDGEPVKALEVKP